MSLTDIKNEILKKCLNETRYGFPKVERENESYYISYEESKHLENGIIKYISDEIYDFRLSIRKMWTDDDVGCKYSDCIIRAVLESIDISDTVLEPVDSYNYMM